MRNLIKTFSFTLAFLACHSVYGQSANEKSPYQVELFDTPAAFHESLKHYRSQWLRLTGFEYSGLHWNQFISVYTNTGEETYKNNYLQYIRWYEDPDDEENKPVYTTYPEGAVILKENFASENGKPGMPISVTAMIKRGNNYDPSNGNWEYLQFDAKGNILLQGNSSNELVAETCANCHRHVDGRDYIFSQIFSTLRSDK